MLGALLMNPLDLPDHTVAFGQDPLAFLRARQAERVARFRLNDLPHVLLNDPRLVHELLVGQAERFTRTDFSKATLRPFMGDGLLTADGAHHLRQRRLMQPAFHHHRIQGYADLMITHIADALDSWRVGERRDVMNTMVALSLGVVTEALFGEDASEAADDLHHMLHLMQSAMAVEFDQPHAAHARSEGFAHDRQVAIDKIDRRIYALIERRRAAGSGGSDLLAMLLNARDDGQVGGMSDQQVRDEIITLFIAGHETTSTTLTWAFWLLGNHPSVYEALLAEVDAHIGSEAPTAARLAALQLPVQIVRETLRLYPTAWLLFNRLASKAAQVHDVAIAADEIVMLSPYLIQRDARYFDDPDAFMPSRFQEGWDRGREKFTYFPFGGGARVCIGQHFALMEASFMLAMVAQRFRFRLTQPQQAVTPLPLTVLQPNVPIEIEVVGR